MMISSSGAFQVWENGHHKLIPGMHNGAPPTKNESYCVPELCPNVGSCSGLLMLQPQVRLLWRVPSPVFPKKQLSEGGSTGAGMRARNKKIGNPPAAIPTTRTSEA